MSAMFLYVKVKSPSQQSPRARRIAKKVPFQVHQNLRMHCKISNVICDEQLNIASKRKKKPNYSPNGWSVPPKQWLMLSLIQSRFDSWLQISKSQLNIVIIQS